MEPGILFSETAKSVQKSQKSFCFAETVESPFWDEEPQRDVSPEEAKRYDAVMGHVILRQFF